MEEQEVAAVTARGGDWSEEDAEGLSDYSSQDSLEENSDEDDRKEEGEVKREVRGAEMRRNDIVVSEEERAVKDEVVLGVGQGVEEQGV